MTPVRSRFLRAALEAALFTSFPSLIAAQGSAIVPIGDPAYAQLDRLEELGVVESAIMAQRPYSYRELGRLVRSAESSLSRRERSARESALVRALLRTIEERITSAAPGLRPVDEVELGFTGTNARRRGFPGNGNARTIEATIDPLAVRRLGEIVPRGMAGYLELAQRADPAEWLSVHARERLAWRSPRDTAVPRLRSELLLAAARARVGNVAVTVGREQIAWAHGSDQGLFLASDAPALDHVSVSGDHPFMMPGPLVHLGPTQATLIVADMGPSVSHSHSRLVSYKVSVRPNRALELGGTFQNHFGGAGSVPAPLRERIFDLLPFIDIFRRHNYTDSTRALDPESNKVIGADARLRLERFGGLTLSGEWLIDDFDVHRLRSLLGTAASHSLAITVPRFLSPVVAVTFSARHMGVETYSHALLTQGITTRGRLLGDELGPDAKAFGAELRWMPAPSFALAVEGRSAIYSDASYFICPPPGGCTRYVLTTVSRRPDELRERLLGTLALSPTAALHILLRGGGERVRNQVGTGGRRHSYSGDMAIRWRP